MLLHEVVFIDGFRENRAILRQFVIDSRYVQILAVFSGFPIFIGYGAVSDWWN